MDSLEEECKKEECKMEDYRNSLHTRDNKVNK
jgi:hypothetical protein